ncbi:MAG: hypothetical protein ACETV1_08140 [Candidatus Bathyarchaeia archaeon]
MTSTGADAADILTLNVGFTKDLKGNIREDKRFIWRGSRLKDTEPFKVHFSEEATAFIKRYFEQERNGAEDSDPLFVSDRCSYRKLNRACILARFFLKTICEATYT